MLNKNFITIVNNIGSNIQDTSTAMQTIIKRYVNNVYFDILGRINWERYNYDYSFTASSQTSALPSDFGSEIGVYDSTNKTTLTRTNIGKEIDDNVGSIAESGSLSRYAIFDDCVRVQPSTAAVITFVSSNASDNSQTCYVRGTLSNGVEVYETVVLTGTSNVSTTNQFLRVITIGKSAVTTGYITATSGTSTLAIMAPEDLIHAVKLIRFYPSPASSVTVNIPYIINPLPLNRDYDVPIIECSDALELGGTARAYLYKRQFAKAADYNSLYEQAISNLIWKKENQPNELHVFSRQAYDRNDV